MSFFDNIKDKLTASFSDWIKINDNKSGFTIEDFPYATGVDEELTNPHCALCVSVNNCYFKNEEDKKPIEFNYGKYSLNQIPFLNRGLYHPHCHCKKIAISKPNYQELQLLINDGKKMYLFSDKLGIIIYMGYKESEKEKFYNAFEYYVKYAFSQGKYYKRMHDKYGFRINIQVEMPGANEKASEIFKFNSGFTIFPNGKLKINTPFGGWTK